MAEDRLDTSLGVILTATISMLVLCYMAIPTVMNAIGSLKGDATQFAPLLTFVLTIMVICIIVLVVRGFNSRAR